MSSGLPNNEKAAVRRAHADGKVGREDLLAAEVASYHSPGTCTFYGTDNSNQVMIEVMGLHLPGATFVNPRTELRTALTEAAGRRAVEITAHGPEYTPVGELVDEKSIVNACVALLATGGSTNHTLHLVAIARAAGILIDWDDFSDLSQVVPLLARIYPNGSADVNHFHAAGGMGFLINELLAAGLMHANVQTISGAGLSTSAREPWLSPGGLAWREAPAVSGDTSVLRPAADPFSADGGLKLLRGNLGRAVIKVSAVNTPHRIVEAPARVFDSQEAVLESFQRGELARDVVVVVRFQGPRANGMPELHGLTPAMASLQSKGHRVALVTDGRMSGASGAVPAAIHLTPEVAGGGPLGKVRDGDVIRLDSVKGTLEARVPEETWSRRPAATAELSANALGMGRELFRVFRANAAPAEEGGGVC
jgi:phosphogluconate dehydratase